MNKKNRIKILLIVLILVVAGIIYSCAAAGAKKRQEQEILTEEETTQQPETEEADEESGEICVHVCGCVASPGVYYLPEGSRIHEAVEKAGGMTEEADSRYVNLAQEAEDGSQIYIPSREEAANGFVPDSAENPAAQDGLVNINTATAQELKTLPGIGQVKADAIIAYRESTGGFGSIEEIMNVAGIKASSYEKIKNFIKV